MYYFCIRDNKIDESIADVIVHSDYGEGRLVYKVTKIIKGEGFSAHGHYFDDGFWTFSREKALKSIKSEVLNRMNSELENIKYSKIELERNSRILDEIQRLQSKA